MGLSRTWRADFLGKRDAQTVRDDRDALEAQVRRLQAASAFKTGGVQIVRRATAASASPTRNLKVNGVIAGLLGMILAAVAIVILSRTDRRRTLGSTPKCGNGSSICSISSRS